MTLYRRSVWACVAGVVWLLASSASAQPGPHRLQGDRHAGSGDGSPGSRRMMPPGQRQEASRDGSDPGSGRLTPEERRQLRRDVHEAGRDLYPDRMPGRREGRRQ